MAEQHMGFILFWLLSPYFTGSAFTSTTTSKSARCIREAEQLPRNFNESFILRSINTELDHLKETSPRFEYTNLDPY